MANTVSAEKRNRQALLHREANRSSRSRMRSAVKRVRAAIAAGDLEQARQLLPETLRLVDKTAQKGVIHANVAARTKSRLEKAVRATS